MKQGAISALGVAFPVATIGGLYALSAMPSVSLPGMPLIPHLDKVVHIFLYAALLSSFRFWRGPRRATGEWLPGAITAACIAAAGDEWHQGAVPGRTPEVFDLLADGVGIAFSALFWARWPGSWVHRRLF